MMDFKVAIIGGGPAGASCAWYLQRQGVNTVIIDKCDFPRPKLCAGWITPRVFKNLECKKEAYPFGILEFKRINFHYSGINIPVRTRQYSIRRFEFDHWLIKRSGAKVLKHFVKKIQKKEDGFIIDSKFRSQYLVGAGGTNCPVARTFFNGKKKEERQMVVAMEAEFQTGYAQKECHLWFFENGLPGYSWYVPKANGYLNIGIGGKWEKLKQKKYSITDHFHLFTQKLEKEGMIRDRGIKAKGYAYPIRRAMGFGGSLLPLCQKGNAFISGDALGLASPDMGEGIGPAVESGILAARSISLKTEYRPFNINKFSVPGMVFQSRS